MVVCYVLVSYLTCRHSVEESLRAVDLCLLNAAKLERVERAFGLCDEVNVLHASLVEGDCPVGGVVSDGSRNVEASRKLCVNANLVSVVKRACEVALNRGFLVDSVDEDVVADVLFCSVSEAVLRDCFRFGENVRIERSVDEVVGDVIDDQACLLLVDEL